MAKKPFIAKIDSLLAERGIAKKDFYRDCEITSATYSQWNTGKTKPKIYSLQKIANYLDISMSELMVSFPANEVRTPEIHNASNVESIKLSQFESDQKEKSPTPEGAELSENKKKLIEKICLMDEKTVDVLNSIADQVLLMLGK